MYAFLSNFLFVLGMMLLVTWCIFLCVAGLFIPPGYEVVGTIAWLLAVALTIAAFMTVQGPLI